jgi:NTE family protein
MGTPAERKSTKMVELLGNTDLRSFVDGDADVQRLIDTVVDGGGAFKIGLRGLQVIDNIRRDLGLNPGKAFHQWLTDALVKEGIETTHDLWLRMRKLPRSLRTRDGERLSVDEAAPQLCLVAADISTETKVEFPKMAPLYWRDADTVNPADYVRASMSIPLFFEPFRVEDVPQGAAARRRWSTLASYDGRIPKACTFVDGGIMSNFPIDLFHQPNNVPTAPTFGAKLGPKGRQVSRVDSPLRLVGATFNAARHTLDYDFIARNPDYKRLMTWINTGSHNWLNFGMSAEDKVDLFSRGVRAAKAFLEQFEWDAYKAVRVQLAKAHTV